MSTVGSRSCCCSNRLSTDTCAHLAWIAHLQSLKQRAQRRILAHVGTHGYKDRFLSLIELFKKSLNPPGATAGAGGTRRQASSTVSTSLLLSKQQQSGRTRRRKPRRNTKRTKNAQSVSKNIQTNWTRRYTSQTASLGLINQRANRHHHQKPTAVITKRWSKTERANRAPAKDGVTTE